MSTIIPPDSPPETRPAIAERAPAFEQTKTVEPVKIEEKEQLDNPAPVEPGKLLVHFDDEAGRFVHTLTDAESQETIWRYPSEAQLAYSRAVMAYLRVLAQK